MNRTLQRVLLIDDEEDIRFVARMALEKLGGFEVAVCSSGAEALQKIESWPPDLILLDVMMPGMDGPATLAKLRASRTGSRLPVVFITAKVQPHETAEYLALGAIGVIAKPFAPMELPASIRELWQAHAATTA